MSSTENFHRATFAIFLLRCLDSQGYFGPSSNLSSSDLTGEKLLIARLLFHFLELLQFNTHEVAQLEMQGRRFEDGAKSRLIGAAVFPTLALFNHSCEPSLTRFFHFFLSFGHWQSHSIIQVLLRIRFFKGDTITAQSIKLIKKGNIILSF